MLPNRAEVFEIKYQFVHLKKLWYDDDDRMWAEQFHNTAGKGIDNSSVVHLIYIEIMWLLKKIILLWLMACNTMIYIYFKKINFRGFLQSLKRQKKNNVIIVMNINEVLPDVCKI